MGKLLNLDSLDLNHNNLSGKISKSLETLNYLIYFDVSFNDLSGEVPSCGPFKNFPSRFFMSNKGLCGYPIYGLPPCHTIGNGKQRRRKVMLGVVFALRYETKQRKVFWRIKPEELDKCLYAQCYYSNYRFELVGSKRRLLHRNLKRLSSIMELALNCSMESANERVNMKEVVVALKKIRYVILAYYLETRGQP
ncbi:unnamed protein product [Fraxinus pennsylvanica]|uniref:Uncharacterized protein n=1 Tax=Fraxinus pennsylvanica TaxID=56036 RepID=A0AAD2A6Z6_9LAMI|nr:unnamed protein product [Fraxinus pennsylvanica]